MPRDIFILITSHQDHLPKIAQLPALRHFVYCCLMQLLSVLTRDLVEARIAIEIGKQAQPSSDM